MAPLGAAPGRRGQAAVEAVALAPLAVAALAGVVAVLGREAAVAACARAASAGVLAAARGDDPRGAARAVLPSALARAARVRVDGGVVRVDAAVRLGPLALGATASAPLPGVAAAREAGDAG